MILGELNYNEVMSFVLILLRTAALVGSLPFYGSPNLPPMVKAGFAMSLALVLMPVTTLDPAVIPHDLIGFLMVAVGEMLIGFILGLAVRMLITAVQIMGQLAGFQMGFAVANVLDPISGGQVSVLAQLAYLMSLLVLLTVNGHHWFFTAMADSFRLVPPGGFTLSASLFEQVVKISSEMFSLAIRLGAPVIGALLFMQVSLGILAKTVPQMNILMVGFPLTISVGLIFMSLTIGLMVPVLARIFGGMGPTLVGLLKAM